MENIPPDIEKNTPPPGDKNIAPSEVSHDLVATALQRKSSRERVKEILERNRKRKEERAARIKERETPSPSKNKESRLKEGETPLPYDPASLAYDYNTYAPWLYSLKHQDDKHECFHNLLPTGEENPLLLELTPLEHTYRKGGLIPNYQAIKGLTRNELLVLFFLLSQFTPNTSAFVYTDTQLALEYAMQNGAKECVVYGGLGGRLDHTLANLQTGYGFALKGLRVRFIGKDCTAFYITDKAELYGEAGRFFSLFAMDKAEKVSIKGAKYEISGIDVDNTYPLGVSNAFTGEKCSVSVEGGVLLAIIDDAGVV